MTELDVHVWSDFACPWCYVGKRNLEAALEALGPEPHVTTEWHSFELDPSAPRQIDPALPYADRLAKKYGTSRGQAQGMIDRMVGMGEKVGIAFDFQSIRPGNTFDAHRLLYFAKRQGKGSAFKERLLAAYHSEGTAIADHNELLRLSGEVGLDVDAAAAVLSSDDFAQSVRDDEAAAQALGVRGVPFFVIGRYGVSGAQPPELLQQVLERAGEEVTSLGDVPDADVCTPESC